MSNQSTAEKLAAMLDDKDKAPAEKIVNTVADALQADRERIVARLVKEKGKK